MIARHCDADGCDTWQRSLSHLPDMWWTLSGPAGAEYHFCNLDHAMRGAAAHSAPAKTVEEPA